MSMRNDPMPAAAEAILIVEKHCKYPKEHLNDDSKYESLRKGISQGLIVCTVGEQASSPGASNVMLGKVMFTGNEKKICNMVLVTLF